MSSFTFIKKHALRLGIAFAAVAVALVLVLPSAVDAHIARVTATCGSVTITWSEFQPAGPGNEGNGGKNSPSWTVTFTPASGGSPVTLTNQPPVSFSGSGTTLVVPIPAVDGSATASTSWTSAQTTNGVSGSMTTTSPIVISNCPTTTTTTTTSTPTSSSVTRTTTTTQSTSSTSTTVTTPTTSVSTTPTSATSPTTTVSSNATTAVTTPAGAVLGSKTTVPCVDTHKTVAFSRSKAGNVLVTVTGTEVKQVAFYVDGRWVKTLGKANLGSQGYRYTVTVSRLRYGAHVVSVTYVGACASHSASMRFARNAPARAVIPKFTG